MKIGFLWQPVGESSGLLDVYGEKIPLTPYEWKDLQTITREDYITVSVWVRLWLMPYMTRKTINERHTSYGLKHIAEKEIGKYVSNGEIKMILAELSVPFKAYPGSPNLCYPLSQNFFKRLESKQYECEDN